MAENKIKCDEMGSGDRLMNFVMVPPGAQPPGPGAVSAWVAGVPAPQGSKRGYARRGRGGKLHVSLVESSERVKPWREDVQQAFIALPYGASVLTRFPAHRPVVIKIVFVMPRPKATPKTKATPAAVKKPDLDKLIRAVLDALTKTDTWAGVYADDSQVVTVAAHKRVAELGETPGAMIHVEPASAASGPHSPGNACSATLGVPGGSVRCLVVDHLDNPVHTDGHYQWRDSAHGNVTEDDETVTFRVEPNARYQMDVSTFDTPSSSDVVSGS